MKIKKSFAALLILALVVTMSPCTIFAASGGANESAAKELQAPASVKALAQTSTSIQLKWSAVKNAKGYAVYKKTDGKWKKIKVLSAKKSYTDKNLKKDRVYQYKIKAYNIQKGKKLYGKSSYTVKAVGKSKKKLNVSQITLNKKTLALKQKEAYTLKARLSPSEKLVSKAIVWTSSNKKVASVSGGTVKAAGAGTCTITARTHNGNTAKCTVKISKAENRTAVCQNGRFVGQVEKETNVLSFKGIPYAKPPVKELRWKAPQAPDSSSALIKADKFGKSSIQCEDHSEPASFNEIGEDCLTLNVWTKDLNTKNKPVMVYFHGGAFAWGGTSDPLYNGEYFVKENEDIVMVTCNYRVGLMGFADFSKVPGGEEYADAPHLGLLDHIQALKWVQNNIASFGGDPDNVTIFGESAGGGTTSTLLVMEEAKGLFHRCISQSGAVNLTFDQAELDATGQTEGLLKITGAKTMKDLVAIPEDELIDLYIHPDEETGIFLNGMFNMPLRDGKRIPADPYKALADGAGSSVDLMIGSNANEWNYWFNYFMDEKGTIDFDAFQSVYVDPKLEAMKGYGTEESNIVTEFLALQKEKGMTDLAAKTEFCNEMAFRMPAVNEAAKHTQAGGRSYVYYFGKESALANMGACHASEVAYVFHNLKDEQIAGKVDAKLAKDMSTAWANFARTGDPSSKEIKWAPYNSDTQTTMVIGNDCSMKAVPGWLSNQTNLLEPLLKYYMK